MTTISVTRVDERRVRLEGDSDNVALALTQIQIEGRFGQLVDSDEADGRTSSLVELQPAPTGSPPAEEQVEQPAIEPCAEQDVEPQDVALPTRRALTYTAAGLASLGLAAWGAVALAQDVSADAAYVLLGVIAAVALWAAWHFHSGRSNSEHSPARIPSGTPYGLSSATHIEFDATEGFDPVQAAAGPVNTPPDVVRPVRQHLARKASLEQSQAPEEHLPTERLSDENRTASGRNTTELADDQDYRSRTTGTPSLGGQVEPLGRCNVSLGRDLAATYDELTAVAIRARSNAVALESTLGTLTIKGHDQETVNEAAAVLESSLEFARQAEKAAEVAGVAADLVARFRVSEPLDSSEIDRPDDADEPEVDLTAEWLAVLRDPDSGQSVGMWRGGQYDLIAAGEGISLEEAMQRHMNDHCAVDWLLEIIEPYDGPLGRKGDKHPAMSRAKERYGERFLKKVIEINDRAVTLPKIADHVERELKLRNGA